MQGNVTTVGVMYIWISRNHTDRSCGEQMGRDLYYGNGRRGILKAYPRLGYLPSGTRSLEGLRGGSNRWHLVGWDMRARGSRAVTSEGWSIGRRKHGS